MKKNNYIRRSIINMVHNGKAAHVGSALSMVEILNSIYSVVDKDKIKNDDHDRDRVILSKGHGTSGLYAVMFHNGLLNQKHIDDYFKNGSLMAGHASHSIQCVEHSTGALGHGLSVGLGIAIGSKSRKYKNHVYVVVGDGELHEGSNWEAIMFAGHLELDNFTILIDKNEKSQMGKTSDACKLDPLKEKFEAFNFLVHELIDGHDEKKIIEVLKKKKDKPVAIICNTIKGKGVSFMENENVWHYRSPEGIDYQKALNELGN